MITKSRQHAASWALLVPYSIFPQNTGGRPPTAQQYIIEISNNFPSYNPRSTFLLSVPIPTWVYIKHSPQGFLNQVSLVFERLSRA